MKTTNILAECELYFKDGDYISEENHVLINNRGQIIRNGKPLYVNDRITTGHPRVSIISKELFLLVDSDNVDHSNNKRHNAWIINNKGKIEQSYFLGSVHRMIISPKFIIVSKTIASINLDDPFEDAIVVFDFEGNILYTYSRSEKSLDLGILENHAFLEKDENTVYYMPYSSPEMFPVIEFSLTDFSSKILFNLAEVVTDKKDPFWFPNGLSKKRGNWYFNTHSPMGDPDGPFSRIYKLNLKMEIEQLATCCYCVSPKGMKNGNMFLPFGGSYDLNKKCQLIEF